MLPCVVSEETDYSILFYVLDSCLVVAAIMALWLKVEMEDMARQLEEGMQALGIALREAKNVTGAGQKKDEPPAEVLQLWEQESLPSRVEDIEVMTTELEA